ncbi:hypothetical protein DO021_13070 [Desulfobacter hydrogenophilus]|uniref:Uncharacterized protein n=1 Tax=Desulfobacter hydrogenophilus TaxID=2291 RepID=A0A328FA90_9BACT|nr:hypothetical protein [Desulfobacter hydrogenophilus]NDY72508.1 hypothetical protein [Desulfobacter hydrogenophilus]QBH14161.1 hypothetical protein EYB58_15315 [Desulfobacter hydrogenophilus]RAM01551.1 hypothetical protein DO021_13070 [Desulfobacter hydrogenophilus]
MAKKMTIFDAVEALELYDLYEDIIDAYEADFYARSEMEADLRDLIEEHDEIYEFSADEDDGYNESFERNLKEAISMIFDDHGLDVQLDDQFMDEDDIDVYDDEPMDKSPGRNEDEGTFEEDVDEDEIF